ncbi:hypothetical protein MTO96_032072 [Rhipicephalus appendiculatus]
MRAPVPVPKPFVCDICDKKFSRRAYLELHGKTHAQARSHECATCGQRFNNLSNLLRHEKLHSSDSRPHVCPHCGKCYARKDYLNVHLATHKEERQYKCGKCERAFSDRRNLKRHHDVVHEKMYPFKCPDCGKGSQAARLGQDLGVVPTPFLCDRCEKAFARRFDMVAHLRTHAQERSYECTICGQRFNALSNLQRH